MKKILNFLIPVGMLCGFGLGYLAFYHPPIEPVECAVLPSGPQTYELAMKPETFELSKISINACLKNGGVPIKDSNFPFLFDECDYESTCNSSY